MMQSGRAQAALLALSLLGANPAWAQGHEMAAPPVAAAAPPTQPRTQSPFEAAFDAADKGDLHPLQRLLPGARGDAALLIRSRLAVAAYDTSPLDPGLARIAAARDPQVRAQALGILTSDAFMRGDYAGAARWGRALGEAQAALGDTASVAHTEQASQIATLLIGHPPQSVDGAIAQRTIPARTDRVGLPRIDVAVNGQAQEAVFDTGASLSVLSTETARRLGVTVIEGGSRVGNGVQGTVAVRLGVADRLEIAGTVLRNVPFLIIDDAQLTFPVPGGYDIKAIIGLPVMHALGRVRMEPAAGRLTVLPPAAADPAQSNLVAGAAQIFVAVAIDGQEVPLHLDTGANSSSLSALYAAANPTRIAALATGETHTGSAGGVASRRVATWRNAPLAVGGRTLLLPMLPISLPVPGAPTARYYGALGSEALRAFESYTLDFNRMRLELGPPVPPAPPAAPAAAH